MRAPVTHNFFIDSQPYRLQEWGHEGAMRIQLAYAHDIAQVPGGVLEALYGADRYANAVVRECLVEAPPFWWEADPTIGPMNGTPRRRVTFAQVSNAHWVAMLREVNAFLEAIFHADDPPQDRPDAGRDAEPVGMADPASPAPRLAGRVV